MDKKHHLFNAYRSVKTAMTMQQWQCMQYRLGQLKWGLWY